MPVTFDYHDAVSYAVPGAGLLAALLAGWSLLGGPHLADVGLGSAVILLVASYLVGHVLQFVASAIEASQREAWGGLPTVTFLSEPGRYPLEVREGIVAAMRDLLGVDVGRPWEGEPGVDVAVAYELAEEFVREERAGSRVEAHLGLFRTFRGLMAVFLVLSGVGLGVFLSALGGVLSGGYALRTLAPMLGVGGFTAVAGWLLYRAGRGRFRLVWDALADVVYVNLYLEGRKRSG